MSVSGILQSNSTYFDLQPGPAEAEAHPPLAEQVSPLRRAHVIRATPFSASSWDSPSALEEGNVEAELILGRLRVEEDAAIGGNRRGSKSSALTWWDDDSDLEIGRAYSL